MKAVTRPQPLPSLVSVGACSMLTDARATSYRGPLLIHAGKVRPRLDSIGAWHVDGAVGTDHYWMETYGPERYRRVELPLGAVVASCRLVDCVPITHNTEDGMVGTCTPGGFAVEVEPDGGAFYVEYLGDSATSNILGTVRDQLPFGDFSPGRWAWLLGDVKPTTERCPRCWGSGCLPPVNQVCLDCPRCEGYGVRVAPVPMRGRQGLWTPTAEDWS